MMRHEQIIEKVLASRGRLPHTTGPVRKSAEEGGCGVTGFMASVQVGGRHIFTPSVQMHNRGNGKGGGIAAVGLSAQDVGVSQQVLDESYLLQIALLDSGARAEIERLYITPHFDVHKAGRIPTLDDYREIKGLERRPPDVWRYLVRVKPDVLARFVEKQQLEGMDARRAEDEFVSQNSFRINQQFYASLGQQRAFVLCHGRNLMVLKVVGYAEQVAQYYRLDDFRAHGWIAHQRYPTKGRVWHPAGAHPFIGLNEALVHNGDFANYHAVCEYLRQHNVYPQFLTDTEVAALTLDLLNRTFRYPLEYIIEALAPTGEYDFDLLPPAKQRIYRQIQSTHIHSSPDGPWFFIIARNDPEHGQMQLIGITDTSMLRPQVFALQDGEVQIGLICSEKQAIDATLESLAAEDSRFCPIADKYWNCRGGSASDGGAFIFTIEDCAGGGGSKKLTCTNKFGEAVSVPVGQRHFRALPLEAEAVNSLAVPSLASLETAVGEAGGWEAYCRRHLAGWDYASLQHFCRSLAESAALDESARDRAIAVLTFLNDTPLPTGAKKRSSVIQIVRHSLYSVLSAVPRLGDTAPGRYRYIGWENKGELRAPSGAQGVLVINATGFPPEGDDCDARLICQAYKLGWRRFICYNYSGQRYCGCGLGGGSAGVRIDVYGSSGDYLASGADGLEIHVHGSAQDQLGQIMMSGKLVIYGDVGQTFMYGAKGGEVYVMGNAAGRPLINAVGKPRVVINGTCLDYLAESFMAGDPVKGGGFVILNGIEFDGQGMVVEKTTPYPGSNLFSLASGGAIYLRDPQRRVAAEQLNGGEFVELKASDWDLISPYLKENERLFGISVEDDLLTVDGVKRDYREVYQKVRPVKSEALKRVEMERQQDEAAGCLPG